MSTPGAQFRVVLVDGRIVRMTPRLRSTKHGEAYAVSRAGVVLWGRSPREAVLRACEQDRLAVVEIRGPGELTTAEQLEAARAAREVVA